MIEIQHVGHATFSNELSA